jgi:aminoglycoside/choline kinase family phosphotransferase
MIMISGYGAFASRLASFKSLHEFLRKANWWDARRDFLQGDASSRAYETLTKPTGEKAILMMSPQRPDGPPIRYGKSYSTIAHLAENVKAFVAIAEGLSAQGFSAPKVLARDLNAGLVIVEDLGREGVVARFPTAISKPSARSRNSTRANFRIQSTSSTTAFTASRLTISTPCWSKSSC